MRSNRNEKIGYTLRFLSVALILLCAGVAFADTVDDPSAGDFEPDKQLLRKFAAMPYSGVVTELEKMSPQEQFEYSQILASVQLVSLKNIKAAMQYCEHALAVSEKHQLPKGKAFLLEGYIYSSTNSIPETIAALNMASDCFRKEKDIESLKGCLSFLGNECYRYGNFEKSRQVLEELLTLCKDADDEQMKAQTLFDVGEVYYRLSEIPHAEKVLNEAKTIFVKSDNQKGLADCLKLLGNIYSSKGKNDKAIECYLQASEAYKKTNDIHGQGNCHFNLGLTSITLKQYPKAEAYLKKAIYFYTEAGSVEGAGISQMELGRVYLLQKDYMKAELALKQAESFLAGNTQYRLAQTKDYLGDLEKARDNIKQSLLYYEASAELYREINLKADEARIQKKIEALKNGVM